VNRHYLVLFLTTDLKQNKRNDKQKRARYQDTVLKTLTDNKN